VEFKKRKRGRGGEGGVKKNKKGGELGFHWEPLVTPPMPKRTPYTGGKKLCICKDGVP